MLLLVCSSARKTTVLHLSDTTTARNKNKMKTNNYNVSNVIASATPQNTKCDGNTVNIPSLLGCQNLAVKSVKI